MCIRDRFISAPFEVRLQYMMNVREMDQKTAVKFLKKMDRQHKKYYEFYTSEKWGTPENYDLCINLSLIHISRAVVIPPVNPSVPAVVRNTR